MASATSDSAAGGCRAARWTPRGRGAVATVRIEGDVASLFGNAAFAFRPANGTALIELERNRVYFGHWGVDVPEEVVFCRLADDCCEIHCHGGDAASKRILEDLAACGCEVTGSRELPAAGGDPIARDLVDALLRATTARAAGILLQQSHGVLREALAALERDHSTGASGVWPEGDRQDCVRRLEALLRWAEFGLHLSQPYRVVLAGRPNVGKSSLINALMGFSRAIVFDEPGTTRDTVTAETAFDGWPVELCDTAGLRESADVLEAAGIARSRGRIAQADCVVAVCDASRPAEGDDLALLAGWPDAIVVAHKSDLPEAWGAALPEGAVRVSSLTGDGVEELAVRIVETLVPEVPGAGEAVPVAERQVVRLREMLEAAIAGEGGMYDFGFGQLLKGEGRR